MYLLWNFKICFPFFLKSDYILWYYFELLFCLTSNAIFTNIISYSILFNIDSLSFSFINLLLINLRKYKKNILS